MHFIKAKGLLSSKNGMNIYRGCTHGCIYCDTRSECYGFDSDFEDVQVKINAPQLLERELRSKRKKCMISTGAMCDPYTHCEKDLGLTRQCLEIIERYGFGLAIQTKSDLVLRDLDILERINESTKCVFQTTLTTADEELCKKIEPNVCTTARRAEILEIISRRGIPSVVWLSPLLPWINDTEKNIRGIIDICVRSGVYGILCFGIGLTLRTGNREYFYNQLDKNFSGLKDKYIGKYGLSYEIISEKNAYLMEILRNECKRNGIMLGTDILFEYMREFPSGYRQLSFL